MPHDSPPSPNKTATSSPMRESKKKKVFDVTMGSYDGRETCELIGAYMLSLIAPKFKNEVGLYRDDGLAICKTTPKKLKKPSKKSAKCSNRMALKSQSKLTKRSSTFLMWPSTSQTGATSHSWSPIINCPMSTNRASTTKEYPTQH